jgi:hypothetical protein
MSASGSPNLLVEIAANNAYLAAKNPWLQRQFHTPLALGDWPFVIGRRVLAGESCRHWSQT